MKLETKKLNIQRSGGGSERIFTIEASAKAFDILSSKIYTDPIAAVIRELSTNAFDSHVEAGIKDVPFTVHLPNSLEPYFYVQDYGVGMSKEDVNGLYSTYFKSTRNKSNDYAGALGLGSKSPFSYTDLFTVESIHNGIQYVYSVFKNESGSPTVKLLSEQKTDDGKSNGFKVQIDVKKEDVCQFISKAKEIYQFFEVKPEIIGQTLEWDNIESILRGDNWELLKIKSGDSSVKLVMGNVCYKVNNAYTPNSLYCNGQVVYYVPIGTCSFATSREELQYEEVTVAVLEKLREKFNKEVLEKIQERIEECDCELDKAILLNNYSAYLYNVTRKGIPNYKKDIYNLQSLSLYKDKLYFNEYGPNVIVSPKDYVFIEKDVELNATLRRNLKHYLNEHENTIFHSVEIENEEEFVKVFGNREIIKLSDIPSVPKKPRKKANRKVGVIRYIDGTSCHLSLNDIWKCENDKNPDVSNAVAVVRDGYNVLWKGHVKRPTEIYTIAKFLGYNRIYGFTKRSYDRLCKKYGLKKLEEEAEKLTQDYVDKLNEFEISCLNGTAYVSVPNIILASVKDLSKQCEDLYEYANIDKPDIFWRKLINMFSIKLPKIEINYQEEFYERYPLLRYMIYGNVDVSYIVDYIELIEGK